MFAIAFDMTVAALRQHHPKGVSAAYAEIARTLAPFGFEWVQGSVYVSQSNDMAPLFDAIAALKAVPWFRDAVRDIRTFRVENWSDITAHVTGGRRA